MSELLNFMNKYMRLKLLFLFLLFQTYVFASSYSIVFIHIGKDIPNYLEDAILQAKLFNEDTTIYVVGDKKPLNKFSKKFVNFKNIKFVFCENLPISNEHLIFRKLTRLDDKWRGGFWRYTSERFFYLEELISKFKLKDVFHLESDAMLYRDLDELLPIFKKRYKGIAAVFDNDTRCIPCFIYIPSLEKMHKLTSFMALKKNYKFNDMEMLSSFSKSNLLEDMDRLPIIFEEYVKDNSLKSINGNITSSPYNFLKNIDEFNSIFDGAAIGQYLDGSDPIDKKK